MGQKGQGRGEGRSSKVSNRIRKWKKDLAKPKILKVGQGDGITASTNGEETCKVSRGEGDKAIRKDQEQKNIDL